MLNAAFTIVMNDMVILKLWLSYYRKYFDRLHVICNGTFDKYIIELDKLKSEMPLTYERVSAFAGDSDKTLPIVTETQRRLLKDHKWVLYSDCDEILIADPDKYTDLKDLMNRYDKEKISCVAYEVLQVEDEGLINYAKPYLNQRKYWFKFIYINSFGIIF